MDTVRVVTEFQYFGDGDPLTFTRDRLQQATSDGRITDFETHGAYPGQYGLALCTFTVDLPMHEGGVVQPSMDYDQAKEAAEGEISSIFGDAVEVRWVSPRVA